MTPQCSILRTAPQKTATELFITQNVKGVSSVHEGLK